MADERLVAALLQQELDAAQRPYFGNPNLAAQGRRANERLKEFPFTEDKTSFVSVNPLMARKAEAIKRNAPAENMLTQYAETMPQNWQQFGQNMAQAYPTPATGASRDQILGAVTQAAVNAGPLMTVYHGSPHRFDKFDASKIGTGEGAQAYGHGLYLAEDPSVGAAYRRQLSGTVQRPDVEYKGKDYLSGHISGIEGQAVSTIADALAKDIPIADAIKQAREIAKARFARDVKQVRSAGMGVDEFLQSPEEYKALLKQIKATDPSSLKRIGDPRDPGNLYKVDLPDEQIAKMLDWDKPLSQQSADVKKAISSDPRIARLIASGKIDDMYQNGGEFYRAVNSKYANDAPAHISLDAAENAAQANASRYLKSLGIPGIRYLDGGSRSGGQGTSNFVVFPGNEGILKILDRK